MANHDGHRQRLRQEFLMNGGAAFTDLRALELLLCYARPRGDVNPLAHELLDRFHSLAGVFDADIEELRQIPGVGDSTAILLKLIPTLGGKYLAARCDTVEIVRGSSDLRTIFAPHFYGARNEMPFLACFDAKLKLLGVRKLSEGAPNGTDIVVRNIVAAALSFNASVVVLAHNHTSGVATPSDDDLFTTRHLRQVLPQMGIDLYDHVILVDDDMVSLRDSGYFRTGF